MQPRNLRVWQNSRVSNESPPPPRLFGIFLTVFLDMLGFGMFIPDLQLRGLNLAAGALGLPADSKAIQLGLLVGFSLAIFSICQVLFSPILGRLSDVRGRRYVLLITAGMNLVSYLLYGFATTFPLMLLSRALGGAAAGNLGVAFAYIADVTTPQNRAKGLGMVGAAFGLGFVLGPAAGVGLLALGKNNPLFLGIAGALLCAINVFYIWKYLPESHHERSDDQPTLMQNFRTALQVPALRILFLMFFLVNLGFTNLETTYFQLLSDPRTIFHLGEESAKHIGGIVLTIVGINTVFIQGFLLPRIGHKFGEVKLVRIGLLVLIPGLALTPFAPFWVPALIIMILIGYGLGFTNPNVNSLISRSSPKSMQGGIFGITQALGSLARILGPLMSAPLFRTSPSAPYLLGAGLLLIPAVAAWSLKPPPEE